MTDEQSPQLPSYLRPFAQWLLDQVEQRLKQAGIGTRYISGTVVRGTSNLVARVGVRRNSGGSTYERRRINLIEGANVSISVADDPTDEEVDVTLAATGGAGTDVSRIVTAPVEVVDGHLRWEIVFTADGEIVTTA